ncbi:MAG: hypothetical protein HC875_20550 [Anaerolineales bacterium]|nr:hypothetical protein [Anaerolineales bacterium]
MSTQTIHKVLQQEIEALSPALIEEVLDFVLFVKARRAEENFLWQQIEETQQYRRQHPDEVMTVTAEEWDKLSIHLDDEA